jgi:hypothetical protein
VPRAMVHRPEVALVAEVCMCRAVGAQSEGPYTTAGDVSRTVRQLGLMAQEKRCFVGVMGLGKVVSGANDD